MSVVAQLGVLPLLGVAMFMTGAWLIALRIAENRYRGTSDEAERGRAAALGATLSMTYVVGLVSAVVVCVVPWAWTWVVLAGFTGMEIKIVQEYRRRLRLGRW